MLVLSRRPGQEIVFPALGIKLRLVRIEGNTARVAVDAPRDVAVFRAELLEGLDASPAAASAETRAAAHDLCNRLSKVTLSLHLFEKLWKAQRGDEATAVLAEVMAALQGLDRDTVVRSLTGRKVVVQQAACRALVVDDDRNERELLAGLLSMNGCECRTAADGDDALRCLAAERPDFVLLDAWMPGRDGKATLQAIRSDERLRQLKVFSISSTPPDEQGVGSGPGGFDAWFPKPLDPVKLWQTMQQQIADSVN
jgi:carbon storage regulator CsrA